MVYLTRFESVVLVTPSIQDASGNYDYNFAGSTLAADRTVTLPLLGANDTFVFEEHTQTLTNKTLTSPTISSISNGTSTLTLPSVTGTVALEQTFVFKTGVMAVSTSNATLASAFENGDSLDGVTLATGDRILLTAQTTASENGIWVVSATGSPTRPTDYAAHLGALTMQGVCVTSNGGTAYANSVWACTTEGSVTVDTTSTAWAQTVAGGVSSGALLTLPQINDASNDHQYVFAVSELTADRTVTLPLLAANDTFVFTNHTQTLTNKTLTLPQINDNSGDHQYQFIPGELTQTRLMTLPVLGANDTFVFEEHTQTLTNKTLTSPTISSISNGTATLTLPSATGTLVGFEVTSIKTANYTATVNQVVPCNTNGGAITVTLPAIAQDGDRITICDFSGDAGTNAITISPNAADAVGNKAAANTDDTISADYNSITMVSVYNSGTNPRWVYV